MKQVLLEIIQKRYADNKHINDIIRYAEKLVDHLRGVTDQTKHSFTNFLKKYNFDTIPQFSEYEEYPTVTLFKGVDNWTLAPVIDYDGGVTDMDREVGIIFNDPEIYPGAEELYDIGWTLRQNIFLTWLSGIWFDIDGPSYGIVVKTLENNSTRGFYFNDLAWDSLSDFCGYNNRSKRVDRFFPSNQALLSIYQRVDLVPYPVYPYQNKWRFFKNGTAVKEFVRYGNETGEKSSTESMTALKITTHKNLFDTLKFEQTRSLALIASGYTEFLPDPKCSVPIYDGAIETLFHSGEHWYYKEQENRLTIGTIESLENKHNIMFPHHFKHYLRLFNGRKYNNINMNFNAGDKYVKMKEFYNIDEIDNFLLRDRRPGMSEGIQWVDIGRTTEGMTLSIHLQNERLALTGESGERQELASDFAAFIKEPNNYDNY